jgi:hypothetical protein
MFHHLQNGIFLCIVCLWCFEDLSLYDINSLRSLCCIIPRPFMMKECLIHETKCVQLSTFAFKFTNNMGRGCKIRTSTFHPTSLNMMKLLIFVNDLSHLHIWSLGASASFKKRHSMSRTSPTDFRNKLFISWTL